MAASFRVRKGSAKKYQILNVIGEGAYGVVLKCRRRSDGALVAVKKFKPSDDTELLVKTANREVRFAPWALVSLLYDRSA